MLSKNTLIAASAALVLFLVGGYVLFPSWDTKTAVTTQTAAIEAAAGEQQQDSVSDDSSTEAEKHISAAPETQSAAVSAADSASVDLAAALKPRVLGSDSAPVTIEEFASLSCNHCAHFSKEVFEKIKEAYIDTGKVKFTYTDFPLNAPAMDGAMLARCLPEDRYFKFVKFLFETQNDWAFGADYRQKLEQSAKLSGASEALVKACLENEPLKQGLVEQIQKASAAHDIKSTPSFVINGAELYKGAHSFEDFSKLIDKKLEESNIAE